MNNITENFNTVTPVDMFISRMERNCYWDEHSWFTWKEKGIILDENIFSHEEDRMGNEIDTILSNFGGSVDD